MNAEPFVRLQRLVIEEIFGPGSHTIDIPFNLDQRVTVLHGRNGSGKTITLGLINALRCADLIEFVRYPFRRFQLDVSGGASLIIERLPREQHEAREPKGSKRKVKLARPSLRYELRAPDGKVSESDTLSSDRLPILEDEHLYLRLKRLMPWMRRITPDLWLDERFGRQLSTHEVLEAYEHQLGPDIRPASILQNKSPELRSFLERIPPVKFIKADRLFVREPDGDVAEQRRQRGNGLMVERLSQDIRALVVQADREYRRISTRLDSSLANRLFEHHKDIPELSELRQRSRDLREQAERLKKLGLLQEDPVSLDEERLSDEQKGTFYIILKDREEKLAPFASVVDKAERLLSSLNRKLAPKSVRLDVEKGYQILTAAGEPLDLENLSSGEQHELVLLHELLFDVRPGSLILIDEPELSLHVTWQVDLLPDLLEIAKLSDLDFVLATHSPYITRYHPELMVRLGEPV